MRGLGFRGREILPDTIFRLVYRPDWYYIDWIKSSLLLKIKWKQHHSLYRKGGVLLSGTASHVTVSDQRNAPHA